MTYQNLSFVDYRNTYYEGNEHSLVDVRSQMEFQQGHVPGAINIPLQDLQGRTQEISNEKPVVVICASGNRSMSGSDIFTREGFSEVYNLQGGTMIWMMNGLPLNR